MAEELTLKVSGMTCGGCESAIRRVLSMVEGVTSATASHQAGEVTVVERAVLEPFNRSDCSDALSDGSAISPYDVDLGVVGSGPVAANSVSSLR